MPTGVYRRAGRVLVDGVERAPKALRGRTIATVLQNPRSAFNPLRTIFDHAREVRRVAGGNVSQGRAAAITTLAEAGIEEPDRVLGLYPFEMSGSMLQRAMIALALLSGPPFSPPTNPQPISISSCKPASWIYSRASLSIVVLAFCWSLTTWAWWHAWRPG